MSEQAQTDGPGPSRPPADEVSAVSDQRIADLVRLATTLADRMEAVPLPLDRPAAAEDRANRLRALREAAHRGQRALQLRAETGRR